MTMFVTKYRVLNAIIIYILIAIPLLGIKHSATASTNRIPTTCSTAITRETWNMALTYIVQDSITLDDITASVDHQAQVQVVFGNRQDFVDTIEWELLSMQGDLSLNDQAYIHNGLPNPWWEESVGAGAPSEYHGTISLDPYECTYDMWIKGDVEGDTNSDNGSASWDGLTVFDINIVDQPVGEEVEFFEQQALPDFVDAPPLDTSYTIPFDNHTINAVYGWFYDLRTRSEPANPILTMAQVTWSMGGTGLPPTINNLEFEHQMVGNPQQWIPVPAVGTIDGNLVRLKAEISNKLNSNMALEVRFLDADTNQLLPGGSHQLTLSAHETLDVSYEWDTTNKAWDAGGATPTAHAPYNFKVELRAGNTVYNTRRELLRVNPRPLILVHGLNSNAETWASYPAMLETIHHDWKAFAVDTLRTGHDLGNQQPSNTLTQNAGLLHHYIQNVRKQENAWQVDIVAHSMGGLISRQYIHSLMPLARVGTETPVVRNLVMLGTPNQGSMCAVGLYYHNKLRNIPNLEAPRDLMPSSVARFNQRFTQQRGVNFSVSYGDLIPFPCSPIANQLSDGVVTTTSARYMYSDVGRTNNHHVAMTGSFEDFSDWVIPHVTTPVNALVKPMTFDVTNETDAQISRYVSGTLQANSTLELAFDLNNITGASMQFIAPPDVEAILFAPDGTEMAAQWAYSDEAMLPIRAFAVDAPMAGTWKIQFNNMLSQNLPIGVTVLIAGSPFMATAQVGTADPHSPLSVTVELTNNGSAVAGATVTGQLVHGNSAATNHSFHDDGQHNDGAANDGIYGILLDPQQASNGTLLVDIQGANEQRMLLVTLPTVTYSVYLPTLTR